MKNGRKHSEKSIRKAARELPPPDERELDRIERISDDAIDYSDIPEQDVAAMGQAGTEQIALRVDKDVLAWFRGQAPGGRGYQTRIRRALRQFMDQQGSQSEELVELKPVSGHGKARRYVLRRVG